MQDGKVFYRKQQLYMIPDKLPNLADYIVAGCRYGGPLGACISSLSRISAEPAVALMRDNTKMIALGRAAPTFQKAEIRVYSASGDGLLLFTVTSSPLPA